MPGAGAPRLKGSPEKADEREPMGKAILMIGGGRLQLPALRWAREAGLRVVVADRDPAAPGRREAHGFEPIAGDDTSALVTLARSLHRRFGLAALSFY